MLAKFNMAKVDPKQVSPWLLATRWHLHVNPYPQEHLIQLVALPVKGKEPSLDRLSEAVHD